MKKFLSVVLCMVLVLGTASIPSTAAAMPLTASARQTDTEVTQENMERVILAVKSKITIPTECTEFEYGFNDNYDNGATWMFSWSAEDYSMNIYVVADNDGNIISFETYSDKHDSEGAPKYLKSELEEKIDAFVYSMSDEYKGSLNKVYQENNDSRGYTFRYERVENGIPMPDNYIEVEVDNRTGEIGSYSANWIYNLDIPRADVRITEEAAAKLIGEKVEMQLRYMDKRTRDDDGNYKIETFLAYFPDDEYIAVDAKTGKIYTEASEWNYYNNSFSSEESVTDDSSSDKGNGLTEQEIEKIEELSDIIAKDDAIKKITSNKSLLLDDSMISVTASLRLTNNYYDDTKRYVWAIELSDPTEPDYENDDYYRASAYATVDAKTGEILSYRASIKDFYEMNDEEREEVKANYSSAKCRKTFAQFAKEQNPERFASTVYSGKTHGYLLAINEDDTSTYGGNTYRYTRVNEDIRYDSNYIYGAVDFVTGKIYNYGFNWYENVEFDSPKDIISEDEAFEEYMSFDGYELVYEIVTVNNVDDNPESAENGYFGENYYVTYETRLVYRTEIYPNYVSAFTGKQLDYAGEEYNDAEVNGYAYDDISDSKYERSILLLADIGIGFAGNSFNPDKAITRAEFQNMLEEVRFYWDDDFKLSGDKKLSRQLAAKAAIYSLDLGKVSEISGIYKTNYADNDSISEKYLGYIALVNGLSLMDADEDNNFNPTAALTRGEAAELIIRIIGSDF